MMSNDKLNKFSVPLGLLDYVNPVLYTITMTIISMNLYSVMDVPYNILLLTGAAISVITGFIIPTGKVLVGMGVISFRMPVSLVFIVNTGIYLSGLMLFKYSLNFRPYVLFIILGISVLLLFLLYLQSKKINTIAVLTGAVGYLMIYISLILLSVNGGIIVPVVLYGLAIMLFLMLCGIGIKANLKNPKVHWLIEISNVTCQLLVTIGTFILFH